MPVSRMGGEIMGPVFVKAENTIKIVIELENLEDDEMIDIIKIAGVEVDGEFR